MNDVQIANWLSDNGHPTPRGNRFKNAHVHSIVKKKRLKDEKLERECPEELSDFSLELVDKTLIKIRL